MRRFLIANIFVLQLLRAQDHNDHHIALKVPKNNDTVCLKDCLLQAHWEAHTRTFFMSTINEGPLKDDYALASGAGIGVLTRPFYGFQLGLSGFFIYNLFSSDIHKPDSITGQPNRYEIGLFDIENHTNKNDLDRLEELYIKYSISNSYLMVGKMNLNTPFMNPQDGRMRPTLEEGVWLSVRESRKIGVNAGWIWDVSPRSTVRWFPVSKSLGIYPMGFNTDGTRANYLDEIEGCSGFGIFNLYLNPSENVKINFWNGFLENVMNTAMVEINTEQKTSGGKIYEGLIYMHQDALNNGGNHDQRKTYMRKGEQSNIISAQIGYKNKRFNTSLNYTHITGDGRYMMPREWGREVFYTFLQRERNEGFGNVHAFMVKSSVNFLNNKMNTALGYGFYRLPDVRDFRLNKYSMPSYHHINYYFNYTFGHFLKGMDLKVLVAWKLKHGETYGNPRYVFNKVNMANFNVVLDFKI